MAHARDSQAWKGARRRSLTAPQFVEHFREIGKVPVLSELAGLDAPNVYGLEGESSTGWRYIANGSAVRRRVGIARHDFVAGNDASVDAQLEIGHQADNSLKILNLGCKPRGTPSGVLDVALGKEFRERGGIMSIDGGCIPIEQRVANFLSVGR